MEQYTIKFNQINHKLTDLRSLNIVIFTLTNLKNSTYWGNGTGKTTLLNMIAQKQNQNLEQLKRMAKFNILNSLTWMWKMILTR